MFVCVTNALDPPGWRIFVTNMLPHTTVWLDTTASKRSGRRLEFHIYPSCLGVSLRVVCLCLNVFEQDCWCVCASLCVSQLIITGTSRCEACESLKLPVNADSEQLIMRLKGHKFHPWIGQKKNISSLFWHFSRRQRILTRLLTKRLPNKKVACKCIEECLFQTLFTTAAFTLNKSLCIF